VTALESKATRLGIKPPGPATLRRYGLTATDWLGLLEAQGWKCPICDMRATTWNTDHEHVAGWRHKPSEERRRYVRGVLCAYCNHRIFHSRMAAAVSARITRYLEAYEARRDS
jgi:hypothetical protein